MSVLADFSATRLLGGVQSLKDFSGKAVLVVNVASKCGNTPQYQGLETLYQELGPKGFVILGFPCNQFGGQEPGTHADIASFCALNYGVTFPMMAKIDVNGPDADPLFDWLKSATPDSNNADIEWNFVKFLVGRDGRPVRRYGDKVQPVELKSDILALL
jgi:glutathione peroxidase